MFTKLFTSEDRDRLTAFLQNCQDHPMYCYHIILAGFDFMIHWDTSNRIFGRTIFEAAMHFSTGWSHSVYLYGETIEELVGLIADKIKDEMKLWTDGGRCYKTIRDRQPIMMSNWDFSRKSERAMVHDMGLDPDYNVTDEDRIYGAVRTVFLSSDPAYYAQDDREYARPLFLEPGEIVRLESNGKLYRVRPVRPRYEYISDIIHFELVK